MTTTTTEPDRVPSLLARLERALLAAAGDRVLALELAPYDERPLDRLSRHVTTGWTRLVVGRGRVQIEVHQALDLRRGSLVVSPVTSSSLGEATRDRQLAVLAHAVDLLTQLVQRTPDAHAVCDEAEGVLDSYEADDGEADDGEASA